jgi:hypothetical protein
MSNLGRIPALVQIFAAEFAVVLFLSGGVMELARLVVPPGAGVLPSSFAWFDLIPYAIGALCLYWLMRTIWRPRVTRGRWVPVHWAGPVPVPNPTAATDYVFASTHPSYIAMDALAVGVGAFIYALWSSGWHERRVEGLLVLALTLVVPVSRLAAWYIFGIRPGRGEGPAADAVVRGAWRPVVLFYGIMVPILAVAGGVAWFQIAGEARARLENAVRLEPAMLEARAFQAIRDTSVRWIEQSRPARLAVVPGEAGRRCVHAEDARQVTINRRVAFGAAGPLLLVLDAELDAALDRRAAARPGAAIEMLGIVMRTPAVAPAWRRSMWCSLAAGGAPAWIVEVERLVPERTK